MLENVPDEDPTSDPTKGTMEKIPAISEFMNAPDA